MRGYLVRKQLQKASISESKKSSPYTHTDQNNTGQSVQRKMNIPSLNLQILHSADSQNQNGGPYQNTKQKQQQEGLSESARSNSIFDHNAFPHPSNKQPLLPQDDINSDPELMKIREKSIKLREEQEQKKL